MIGQVPVRTRRWPSVVILWPVARRPSLMWVVTVIVSVLSVPMTRTPPAPVWTSSVSRPAAGTGATVVVSSWASTPVTWSRPKPSTGTATITPARRQGRVGLIVASALQEPQHGQHAPVVVVGGGQVELGEDVA